MADRCLNVINFLLTNKLKAVWKQLLSKKYEFVTGLFLTLFWFDLFISLKNNH